MSRDAESLSGGVTKVEPANSPGLVYRYIHDIMSAFVGRRNHLLEIPHPVARTICASGKAPVVIVCEHASNDIPDCLVNLGVDAEVCSSPFAIDASAEVSGGK